MLGFIGFNVMFCQVFKDRERSHALYDIAPVLDFPIIPL